MDNSMVPRFLVAVILLLLVGCSQSELLQKFASPEEQSLAKGYVDLLRQQKFDDIEKEIDASIGGASLHDTLVQMGALIPNGEPTSVKLVGAHRMNMDNSTTVNLTFEYEFSGKWLLANVAVKKQGGKNIIMGFNITPQSASLEEQNKFTLNGKTTIQYIVFTLAIIFPLLTLYALVICVRTKLKGKKWPWVLFLIFGFGKFAVNWTTGQWAFAPLSFQLSSASATAPLFGQWTLGVSLPFGAVIFLLLRKKLRVPA